MKKTLFLIAGILLISFAGFGQRNYLGVNIKVYDPLSNLGENISALPIGLSFSYLHGFENNRFSVGAELGVAMYSSNDYELNYQGWNISVNEEDCFWTLHGVLRYDLIRNNSVNLYAEARIGITTFFSSIIAYDENSPYPGEFSFHGTAFNTGLGGGLMLNPHAIFSDGSEAGRLWIELGVNVHSGTVTDYRYMPEGGASVPLDEGEYESLTHYVGYKVGFVFDLF